MLPIGFLRTRGDRCEMDPDRRIRRSIGLVFEKFEELGSIRQVLLWFRQEGVELPSVEYGPFGRGVAADAGSMSHTVAPRGGLSATAAVARRSITERVPASRSAASRLTEPWRKPFSPSSRPMPWRLPSGPRSTPWRTGSGTGGRHAQARAGRLRGRARATAIRRRGTGEPSCRPGELERRRTRALEVVAEVEREWVAFEAGDRQKDERINRAALLQLAEDLPGVWHDPESDMRLKKRIVRTLIEEILVDVDEESARIRMVVRWAGGQHAQLSVRKRRKGQHRYTTDRKGVEIVRELAAMVPDGQIARILNRLGFRTGRNNSWTAGRVNSLRNYHGIPVHDPATCLQKGLLTLQEAAASLDVSPPVVGRLLRRGILPGRQVVPYAPWTIRAADLQKSAVQEYIRCVHAGRNAPRTPDPEQLTIDPTST